MLTHLPRVSNKVLVVLRLMLLVVLVERYVESPVSSSRFLVSRPQWWWSTIRAADVLVQACEAQNLLNSYI